jgi:hypothetical protein
MKMSIVHFLAHCLAARSLTLIAPRIGPALAHARQSREARWPCLARLAGRSKIHCLIDDGAAAADLAPWQTALLDALGMSEHARYPSAAVTHTGDAQERARGFWLHAQPMHFSAGLDRLSAVLLQGASRVAPAEQAQLVPALTAHLRSVGFELLVSAGGEWLVRCDRALEVATVSPEFAVAGELEQALPRGPDAPALKRLMTELQMLLHEHPVGTQRQRRGVPTVNAIWFHGAGAVDEVPRQALPQAFGEDAYLRGIYRLHELAVAASPVDANALLSQQRASGQAHVVAVVEVDDLDTLEALWMAPLARALALGATGGLELVLDRWRMMVPPAAMLRFWRPRRSPMDWMAC